MHGTLSAMRTAGVSIRYPVWPSPEAWEIPEGPVPEATDHDDAVDRIKYLLLAWAARSERPVRIVRNLAVRWLEEYPRTGIDPDVCVLDPPPADQHLSSLRLWKEGHHPPTICFEVVSTTHPYKDYGAIQDRYAALGTRELVVFDPRLAGPRSLGGPALLQLWRRDMLGVLERVHFGNDPFYSEVLGAWLLPSTESLEISDDREGQHRWQTLGERDRAQTERERAAKERERAEKERERAEKEHERAEKERERAEKEQERAARLELERRLSELEAKSANGRKD